jgi:hypothetical protein
MLQWETIFSPLKPLAHVLFSQRAAKHNETTTKKAVTLSRQRRFTPSWIFYCNFLYTSTNLLS